MENNKTVPGNNQSSGEDEFKGNDHSTIKVDYTLYASLEKVWKALTEPKLVEFWLFPNNIAAVSCKKFTFNTTPAPGFDGIIHCEIKEVTPLKSLIYTWVTGPLDTKVTWTCFSAGEGQTQLSLLHEGFKPEDLGIYKMLDKGWRERSALLLIELLRTL